MNSAFQSGTANCYGEECSGPPSVGCIGCFSHGLLGLFDNLVPDLKKIINYFINST